MRPSFAFRVSSFILLVVLAAACTARPEPTRTPVSFTLPTEMATAPTATVPVDVSPAASATPALGASATPTVPSPTAAAATAVPTAAQRVRIQFQPGATSATVQGSLAPAETDGYVLGAMGGQTMSVVLTPTGGQALLVIWGADGEVLISDHAEATQWSGVLPSTQDYYIDVRTPAFGDTVNYSLQVVIPPLATPQPTRIQFQPGGTSATVEGSVPAGSVKRYVLGALFGQIMSVYLTPSGGQAVLDIRGADGNTLVAAADRQTEYHGRLPSTQDYYIEVHAASSGGSVGYRLEVVIPPPATPDAEPTPVRIQFRPGATSATVQGTLAAAEIDRYVLGAMGGQTMSAVLTPTGGQALIVIWGADGDVLISDHAEAKQWSGPLPRTQDYYIDVVTPASGGTVNYTLQVTIPPLATPQAQPVRIEFRPGATSATVQGTVPGGGAVRYVLRALFGQIMSVYLTPSGGQAVLDIRGADGNTLVAAADGQTEYHGRLPSTQDYYIEVRAAGSATVQFSLEVEIPPPQ